MDELGGVHSPTINTKTSTRFWPDRWRINDRPDQILKVDWDRSSTPMHKLRHRKSHRRSQTLPTKNGVCPLSNVTRGQMAAFLHRALA
jgi:hypothetical protein